MRELSRTGMFVNNSNVSSLHSHKFQDLPALANRKLFIAAFKTAALPDAIKTSFIFGKLEPLKPFC